MLWCGMYGRRCEKLYTLVTDNVHWNTRPKSTDTNTIDRKHQFIIEQDNDPAHNTCLTEQW